MPTRTKASKRTVSSMSSPSAHWSRQALGGLLVGVVLLGGTSSASASDEDTPSEQAPPEEPEGISSSSFAESVTRFDPSGSRTTFDPDGSIEHLGGAESDEENVIVLEADILFSSNDWELPSSAAAKIAELAEEVPDGASVEVHGHTDSLPVDESQFDFDNQELSENRAQAVADGLADQRSDLSLDVEGFGDSRPAVTEDEEDPSTFAANRRVEIRYGD